MESHEVDKHVLAMSFPNANWQAHGQRYGKDQHHYYDDTRSPRYACAHKAHTPAILDVTRPATRLGALGVDDGGVRRGVHRIAVETGRAEVDSRRA